jgi:hypothetical protein
VVAGQNLGVRRVVGFDIDARYLQVAAGKAGTEVRAMGGCS